MKKSYKVLLSFGVAIVTVFAFALVSFAEVSSAFTETDDGFVIQGSISQTILLSGCPDDFDIKNTTYTGSYVVKIRNDLDTEYSFSLVGFRSGSVNAYWPTYRINGSISPGYQPINSYGVTFTLSSGDYVDISIPYNNGDRAWVEASISPDPQPLEPLPSILSIVSDFCYSMFSSWSSFVSLIISSWIFLVPLTMMVLVFLVVTIRKIVKGV